MTWQTFVFLPIAGLAFGYSGSRLLVLWKMMKAMKGKDPSRFDRIPERIKATILNVLG